MKTGCTNIALILIGLFAATVVQGQGLSVADSTALLPIDSSLNARPLILEDTTNTLLSIDSNAVSPADTASNLVQESMEEPTQNPVSIAPKDKCSMQFVKYKSEHDPKEIYFNVLTITNNSNKPVIGALKFSVPSEWKRVLNMFGDELVKLDVGESKSIPIRVTCPKLIVGGLAYVISAELIDAEEIPLIPAAYTYVQIPRISDWKMSATDRYIFVNDEQTVETLKLNLSNRGNAEENIKISVEVGSRIKINGSESKRIELGVLMQPYTDTILEFQAEYLPAVDYFPTLSDNKVVFTAIGEDDLIPKNINFFFEKVNSKFVNELIDDEAPLIAWLDLFNVVNVGSDFLLQGGVKGTILLNDKRRVKYHWNNGNLTNKNTNRTAGENYYNFSRFYVTYATPKYSATVGDITMSGWMLPLNGRGIGGTYKEKKYSLNGSITKNIFNPVYQAGVKGSYKINKTIIGHADLVFRRDNIRSLSTISPGFGATARIDRQSITAIFSVPIVSLPTQTKLAYGHQFTYSLAQVKNLQLSVYNRLTSDWFVDLGGNFSSTNVTANYFLRERSSSINYTYNGVLSNPSIIDGNQQKIRVGNRSFHINNLLYSKSFKNGTNISTGPGFQYYAYDFSFTNQPEFTSNNYTYTLIANKRRDRNRSTSGTVQVGYTNITQFDLTGNPTVLDPYINASIVLNSRFKRNGFIFGYYYGSPSYTSQRYLNQGGAGTKSLRINPYFNFSVFDKKLDVQSNISLWYFINTRITRMSIFNYLDYKLGKGWSLTGNILFYYFKRSDIESSAPAYLDFNMNIGIRKVFDFNQPRQSYQNLDVIFFKDLNGNKVKDENEVGIPDIMVTIENKKDSLNVAASEYFVMHLMTDQFGKVACERIPTGIYTVTTQQSDASVGEYINQLGEQFELVVDADKIQYVPFIKSNKIYGSIVIKRDPFSAMGYVSPANIRISAIDSVGNTYSALSDKDGDFILFTPQAGLYRVLVKNIFGESFKLRQEEFVVDFNGLKEFVVTFLFEEQKRKINFKGDVNGFNFAENNFNLNNDTTKISSVQGLNQPMDKEVQPNQDSLFDDPKLIERPIMKEMISFKVQVGAYNTKASADLIKQVEQIFPDVEELPTQQGLTRLVLGEFKTRAEAEDYRQGILRNDKIPNKDYIVVVGEYFGKYLTADEAEALLND